MDHSAIGHVSTIRLPETSVNPMPTVGVIQMFSIRISTSYLIGNYLVYSRAHLESMSHKLGKTISYEEMMCDPDVEKAVLTSLHGHGLKEGLEKFEVPHVLTLVPEVWTPESGLITAAFKIKRKVIQTLYQKAIDRMYA